MDAAEIQLAIQQLNRAGLPDIAGLCRAVDVGEARREAVFAVRVRPKADAADLFIDIKCRVGRRNGNFCRGTGFLFDGKLVVGRDRIVCAALDCHGDGFRLHAAAERCLEDRVGCGLFAVYEQKIATVVFSVENAVMRAECQVYKACRAGNIDGVFRLGGLEAALVGIIVQRDRIPTAGNGQIRKGQRALDRHHIVCRVCDLSIAAGRGIRDLFGRTECQRIAVDVSAENGIRDRRTASRCLCRRFLPLHTGLRIKNCLIEQLARRAGCGVCPHIKAAACVRNRYRVCKLRCREAGFAVVDQGERILMFDLDQFAEGYLLQLRRVASSRHRNLENIRCRICRKGLLRVVIGIQRGKVGVLLPADDGIEVYDVACVVDLFSGYELFAVFIGQAELDSLVYHFKLCISACTLFNCQRIDCFVIALGNRDQNILLFAGDFNRCTTGSVKRLIVYRNGVAAERRRGVDRHRGILFQNFIGVGKLCTGEGLVCRRARAGLSFEIQTGERRLAIKLQGKLFVLRIASVLHADAEDHRIAACAAQERLCQLLVFCACRNGLADGFPSGIPVICRDARTSRLTVGAQAEIRIDVAAEGVRHGGAPRIVVLGRGQGEALFVKFGVIVAGFGERERSRVDPLVGWKRGKVFELLVFALNGQLAADRAVTVSDEEGVCAVRQAQRSVRFGFKLLFVAAFRRDRAAGKASAKRHGI